MSPAAKMPGTLDLEAFVDGDAAIDGQTRLLRESGDWAYADTDDH